MSWTFLLGFVCYLHKDGCLLLHLLFHFLEKVNKRECVVLENIPHTPPFPSARRATVIPRGGGSKRGQFPRGVGCLQSFSTGLSKIGELLINNSFSVEQAISYFTVTGVALIIVYLRSAKCFFHG